MDRVKIVLNSQNNVFDSLIEEAIKLDKTSWQHLNPFEQQYLVAAFYRDNLSYAEKLELFLDACSCDKRLPDLLLKALQQDISSDHLGKYIIADIILLCRTTIDDALNEKFHSTRSNNTCGDFSVEKKQDDKDRAADMNAHSKYKTF